jgi:hypothetical protein
MPIAKQLLVIQRAIVPTSSGSISPRNPLSLDHAYIKINKAYHPKRLESSATLLGEPQIWLLFIGTVYPTTLQILEMHIIQ